MSVSVAKELAIVYFDSHESAKNAKANGKAVSAMLPEIGAIFFGKGSFAVLFVKKCQLVSSFDSGLSHLDIDVAVATTKKFLSRSCFCMPPEL